MARALTILDGPMGTQLLARGVPTPLPGWSAHAIESHPEAIAAIHRDYARAGAAVHTANTFRARRRTFPLAWRELAARAVRLARRSVPPGHRIAGSIAPLEDCYRPDLSPAWSDPRAVREEHRELAQVLAGYDDPGARCDLLLCETFPHPGEALIAAEQALATGLETWLALTPGPDADLLAPVVLARTAAEACRRGVSAALVNCAPATRTLEFVRALAEELAPLAIPFGAYANAGRPNDRVGWTDPDPDPDGPRRYADLAQEWIDAGATIIGSCCGTGPAHIAELARRLGGPPTTTGPLAL